MSTTKKLPAHGTRARYRLEIKKGPDGVAGKACEKCRTANSQAVRRARANREANAKRAQLHIVGDGPAAPRVDTSADTSADTTTADPASSASEPGPMEKALKEDLAEIPENERVPFHRSLSAIAEQLARDVDSAETPTQRTSAARQLSDVIKSLRVRREGDGTTALDAFLDDFGSGPPALPGRRA